MEKELQDHFKDATNLLLMDQDSGFVEMTENTFNPKPRHEPENFLLSEDALQEKPELSFNFDGNFQYDINPHEYEESRKLFFSPEFVATKSNEISLQPPLQIAPSDIPSDVVSESDDASSQSSNSNYANHPRKLTLVFSKKPSESYTVKRKYPSLTPEKTKSPPLDMSPDIFDDTEVLPEPEVQPIIPDTRLVEELDQKLLKRVQKSMSGVLPPPSVTVVQFSLEEMMRRLQENEECAFWRREEGEGVGERKSLLLSTRVETARTSDWPETYMMRCHGICYNSGKTSEEIVDLCDKYQKRHVGAETQSSCTVYDIQHSSPSRRRSFKPKWCANKSPGRRLSHLARRRITFSSNNLNTSSCLAGSRARQILVDAKKIDLNRRKSPRKTPRRTPKKTPSKSPKKTRTPSSSAKKKLALRFRKLTGEIEQTNSQDKMFFKSPAMSERKGASRSLFSSPAKEDPHAPSSVDKNPRRALFQSRHSPRKSPFKFGDFEKKRKRSESDFPPAKFPRSISMDVKMGDGGGAKILSRTQSEMNMAAYRRQSQGELSDLNKKKLLWAVSTALQTQNTTSSHPQWKTFASVLARVTRIIFTHQTSLIAGKSELGTSEKMQRIARSHALSVIKGKTADEIVQGYFSARNRVQKPQGYVAPAQVKISSGIKENVFQDRSNTIESWEKKKLEQLSKPSTSVNKIERIKKVINFGDDS